ncbi:MAG TPA: FtsW/RodA/SpoVE family cell cycle protein, partial [Methylomirabilota bacterium]|nr:FtsW/RodA/SpoVE family cell cycle protein [Methylomirabilota bacterium]
MPMLRIDRRLILHFDWPLCALAAGLCGAGLLTLWSLVPRLAVRQLLALGVATVVFLTVVSIDYRTLARWAYPGYLAGLSVLAAVLVFGRAAQGARRWISLGPLSLQPSELFKLGLLLVVARYLASRDGERPGWDRVLVPLALTAPALALIVKQPDLGTALVLLPVVGALVVAGGARWRDLGLLVGAGLAVAPALWFLLHDYQRQRLLV